jgi:hypothetical protein
MSLREMTLLFGRHKIATALVLVVALMVAVYIKKTPPMYQETATVIFIGPGASANPYAEFTGSLVATGYVVIRALTSPSTEERIQEAGGSAAYTVALANGYNLQYPVYSEPYGTITSMSQSPAAVLRTFAIVAKQLNATLASRQAEARVPQTEHIVAHLIGGGLTVVSGSHKRVYPGVLLLSAVALFLIVGTLDKLRRMPRVARARRSMPGSRPSFE